MRAVGQRLRAAQVRAIYLVHGTFVGTDALGLLAELERVWPSACDLVRRWQKQTLDAVAGDMGNYTQAYADAFSAGINGADAEPHIPVRLFHWSSENHHVGRAQAAIELLRTLVSRPEECDGRVLLWGHSHGGNVFALLTNLLAADEETRRRFFRAARPHYRVPLLKFFDFPVWREMQRALRDKACDIRRTKLDFVTFGTPVRYGWDSDGYSKLLHFVFHRPVDGLPKCQALFPPTVDDVLTARYGDYIQQIGIAGTNFAPGLLSCRTLVADWRLNRFLQPGIRGRDLLARLRLGLRTHADGESLLVDYGPTQAHIGQHLAGHAIYTRLEWLLFHAEEVARRFYTTNAG
ncbi:MAG: hypothetical protein KDA55_18150 [Planctomycetales bacterium]|nr:hypothetical protein [Planctomycetales bacterium]